MSNFLRKGGNSFSNPSYLLTRPAKVEAEVFSLPDVFFFFFSSFFSILLMISWAIFPLSFSASSVKDPISIRSVALAMLPKQTDWLRMGVPRVKLLRTRGSTETDPSPNAKSFGLIGARTDESPNKRFSRRIAVGLQLGRLSWSPVKCCWFNLRDAKNSAMPNPLGLLWVLDKKNPDLLEARTRLRGVNGCWCCLSPSKFLEKAALDVAKTLFLLARRFVTFLHRSSSVSLASVELDSL